MSYRQKKTRYPSQKRGCVQFEVARGQRGDRVAVGDPPRSLAAWVGAHECDEQACEPVRQDADAPELEGLTESVLLLVVELDGPACADGYEAVDDRVCSWDEPQFREQRVAVRPGDLDDLAGHVYLHFVESPACHVGTTSKAPIR